MDPQPALPVTVVKSPPEIYHPDESNEELRRWTAVLKEWQNVYGGSPDFIARSPGRVNIIGEHIDYSLFPVLPMAIHADTLIAVRVTNPGKEGGRWTKEEGQFTVKIANLEKEKFPSETMTFPYESDIPIDADSHAWTNYFRAGLRGAFEYFRQQTGVKPQLEPKDMEVLVHGTVPPAGGLSSSASLTSTSTLAVLYAHGWTRVDKTVLTQLAIVSERAVGVNSGG